MTLNQKYASQQTYVSKDESVSIRVRPSKISTYPCPKCWSSEGTLEKCPHPHAHKKGFMTIDVIMCTNCESLFEREVGTYKIEDVLDYLSK